MSVLPGGGDFERLGDYNCLDIIQIEMMTFIHTLPDLRTLLRPMFICITDFGKRSLKYKAAKFYNNLPEEIRFDLGDWVRRYNKSVLRHYPLNTAQ